MCKKSILQLILILITNTVDNSIANAVSEAKLLQKDIALDPLKASSSTQQKYVPRDSTVDNLYLENFLKGAIDGKRPRLTQLRNFYKSCAQDFDSQYTNHLDIIKKIIHSSYGYEINETNTDEESMTAFKKDLTSMHTKLGHDVLFDLQAHVSPDGEYVLVNIYPGSFVPPSLNFLFDSDIHNCEERYLNKHSSFVAYLRSYMGEDSPIVYNLERDFGSVRNVYSSKYDDISKPLTINHLNKDYGLVNWSKIIESRLKINNWIASKNDRILLHNENYFDGIMNVYNAQIKYGANALNKFVQFHLLDLFVPKFVSSIRRLKFEMGDKREVLSSQKDYCMEKIKYYMGDLLASEYIIHQNKDKILKRTTELINKIQSNLNIMINNSYIEDSIKPHVKKYLERIKFEIGYPPYLLNDTLMSEYDEMEY